MDVDYPGPSLSPTNRMFVSLSQIVDDASPTVVSQLATHGPSKDQFVSIDLEDVIVQFAYIRRTYDPENEFLGSRPPLIVSDPLHSQATTSQSICSLENINPPLSLLAAEIGLCQEDVESREKPTTLLLCLDAFTRNLGPGTAHLVLKHYLQGMEQLYKYIQDHKAQFVAERVKFEADYQNDLLIWNLAPPASNSSTSLPIMMGADDNLPWELPSEILNILKRPLEESGILSLPTGLFRSSLDSYFPDPRIGALTRNAQWTKSVREFVIAYYWRKQIVP